MVEKKDVRIKARSCADGSKQRIRPGYKKEDDYYPTVSNEGVTTTSAIEANDKHHVACI